MSRQEPMTLGERFGANLLRSRRLAGLSQEGLADLVGMNRASVSVLEHGLRLARIDTILQLAAGTSVSTCVLLEEMEWRPARSVDGDFYVPTISGLRSGAATTKPSKRGSESTSRTTRLSIGCGNRTRRLLSP